MFSSRDRFRCWKYSLVALEEEMSRDKDHVTGMSEYDISR